MLTAVRASSVCLGHGDGAAARPPRAGLTLLFFTGSPPSCGDCDVSSRMCLHTALKAAAAALSLFGSQDP